MCKDNFIPLTFKLHRSTSHYANTKTDICNVKKNMAFNLFTCQKLIILCKYLQ